MSSNHAKAKTPVSGRFPARSGVGGHVQRLEDRVKDGRMVLGDGRKYLAIELNAGGLERRDEAAVGHAVRAQRGVEAHGPQAAEVALLATAVAVGVLAGLELGGDRELEFRLAAPHHSPR